MFQPRLEFETRLKFLKICLRIYIFYRVWICNKMNLFSRTFFQVDARNRRLFGSLMGTLQKFSMEEKKKKEMTLKKKEVEKKIEEKTEKEKEDLKLKRRELLDEQRQKKQDIRYSIILGFRNTPFSRILQLLIFFDVDFFVHIGGLRPVINIS